MSKGNSTKWHPVFLGFLVVAIYADGLGKVTHKRIDFKHFNFNVDYNYDNYILSDKNAVGQVAATLISPGGKFGAIHRWYSFGELLWTLAF